MATEFNYSKLKKGSVLSIFGTKLGTKLLNWLDPCCTEFCSDVQNCGPIILSGTFIGVFNIASTVTITLPVTLPSIDYQVVFANGNALASESLAAYWVDTKTVNSFVINYQGGASTDPYQFDWIVVLQR